MVLCYIPYSYISNLSKKSRSHTEQLFINAGKFHIVNKNPKAPKLYGLIKTHKVDLPIRPIVSYINNPARALDKKTKSFI